MLLSYLKTLPIIWEGGQSLARVTVHRQVLGHSCLLLCMHQGAPAPPCTAGDPGSSAMRWGWIQPLCTALDQGQWICNPSLGCLPHCSQETQLLREEQINNMECESLAPTDTPMPRGVLVPALHFIKWFCSSKYKPTPWQTVPNGDMCKILLSPFLMPD